MDIKVTNMLRCFFLSSLVFLFSCSSEPPVKFLYDAKSFEEDFESYVLYDGEKDSMKDFGYGIACAMITSLFSKELHEDVDKNKNALNNMNNLNVTPIVLHSNKIEWVDFEKSTSIKNNKTVLPFDKFPNEDLAEIKDEIKEIQIFNLESSLVLGIKVAKKSDEGFECRIPFVKESS